MPEFKQAVLSNGLRIVAETDPRNYSAAFGYFVAAGSRNEVDFESGLSHFLEHMMFKGTARRSAADVNRELDELGGTSNAYTSEEQTVYYATVLPKFQDRIVDLLTDMLSPSLDEDDFETERQVILEEIAKYEDQPPFGAFERAMELYFSPRGLGRRVLGTAESIRSVSADSMRDYFNRRYRPDNIVLAATGNVDFEALVKQIEQSTSHWATRPQGKIPNPDDPKSIPEGIQLERSLRIADANQAYIIRISGGPSVTSEERFATRILASIVGDEGGSRLFWELIDTGLAEVATVWPQEFLDTGAWFSYLSCAPEDVESNRRLFDAVLQRVADNGVNADELEQAINKSVASLIMQSERPSNRLFGLGSRWLTTGKYNSLDTQLDRVRNVTAEQVNAAAKKYLSGEFVEIVAQCDD